MDTLAERIEGKRHVKAALLARHLGSRTPDEIAAFTDEDRRAAENATGVGRRSDTTWRVVTEMLAGSTQYRAHCPGCGIGAPDTVPGPVRPNRHEGPCAR